MKKFCPLIISMIMQILTVPFSHTKTTTATSWKTVDLVYFQNFPLPYDKTGHNIPDCLVALDTLPTSGFRIIPVLRCKEQIHLLRPDSVVQNWKSNQAKNGFIKMSLPDFGLHYVKAKITAIASIPANKMQLHDMQNKNTDQTTAIFIRHATNIKKYRFKEESTGRIITVNATDNHLFYVKNKHDFVPVKDISRIDKLITQTGGYIRLLCSDNKWHNCGYKTAQFAQPTPVYNLEINQRHTYFVTDIAILVHNDYVRVKKKYYYESGVPGKPGQPSKPHYDGEILIDGENPKNILGGILSDRDGWGISYYHCTGNKCYEGQWKRDKYHGLGILFDTKGRMVFHGEFKNGLPDGKGTEYSWGKNNEKLYTGRFHRGLRSGKGVRHHPYEETPYYTGEFKNGLPDDSGTSYTHDKEDNMKFLYPGGRRNKLKTFQGKSIGQKIIPLKGLRENNSYL